MTGPIPPSRQFQDIWQELQRAHVAEVFLLREEIRSLRRTEEGDEDIDAVVDDDQEVMHLPPGVLHEPVILEDKAMSPPRPAKPCLREVATLPSDKSEVAHVKFRDSCMTNVTRESKDSEAAKLEDAGGNNLGQGNKLLQRTNTTIIANAISNRRMVMRKFVTVEEEMTLKKRLVSGPFSGFYSMCIILNTLLLAVQTQYSGYLIGITLGVEQAGEWPDLSFEMVIAQHFFNLVFFVELVINLWVYRFSFFYDRGSLQKFNCLDGAIVGFTVVENYILAIFWNSAASNILFVRLLRFFRILRSLRIVRTLKAFASLRVLVATVASSFLALFWSMVLLFVVMLLFALGLCATLSNAMIDEDGLEKEDRLWIYQMYGTSTRSMYTVFELTFSGCWPNYARQLVEKVWFGYALVFALYISIVVFAMFRIITALFLKDTLNVAQDDADMMVQQQMKEKEDLAAKLLDFFIEADTSGDGVMSYEEFSAILKNPKVKTYLGALGLDAAESENLFKLLGDEGNVTMEEFVKSSFRLKGLARSQDIVLILHQLKKQDGKMRSILKRVNKLVDQEGDAVSKVHTEDTTIFVTKVESDRVQAWAKSNSLMS